MRKTDCAITNERGTTGPEPGAARRKIWLASYPRSGNTFLRSILYNCFGLPTTSIYGPADLGRNVALERFVGHFNLADPPSALAPDMPLLVKTHARPKDTAPAIYVVRDGFAVAVSLWEFNKRPMPFPEFVMRGGAFGNWSDHLRAWQPWARPDTLLLRYEDMVEDLPAVLARLSGFLDRPMLSPDMPSRSAVAAVDGRWVREWSDWRPKVSPMGVRLFRAVNGDMLSRLGYAPDGGVPAGRASAELRVADGSRMPLTIRWAMIYWRLRARIRRRLKRTARRLLRSPARRPAGAIREHLPGVGHRPR